MYTKPISYSGLKTYKKCPRLWEDAYILGNRTPSGPAAQRGTELHAEIEQFFIRGTQFPQQNKVLAPWRPYMEALTLHNPSPEAALAVDVHWKPTAFDAEDAYYRGLADLTHESEDKTTLHIFDWKSGKIYPEHEDQGRTYVALSAEYESYFTHFVYLDLPTQVITRQYTHNDRIQEIRQLREDIEIIRNAEVYEPTPSHAGCKWCHLNWRKGGICRAAP